MKKKGERGQNGGHKLLKFGDGYPEMGNQLLKQEFDREELERKYHLAVKDRMSEKINRILLTIQGIRGHLVKRA